MSFTGDQIMALLATWKKLGKSAVFVANEPKLAYVYDEKDGTTLQWITPERMRN